MPGLTSQTDVANTSTAAAQILPQLVAAGLSRRNELEADAFSIKIGVSKLENPCGMVNAIRNFKPDQDTLPFATHPNTKDRLEVAHKVVADEGAGMISGTSVLSGYTAIIAIMIIVLRRAVGTTTVK
jgi:predicted Zn-dependent protease